MLDKKNIIVFGANGFIGNHISRYLLSLNHNITACDLSIHTDLGCVYYNIKNDSFLLSKIFSENHFDFCINAAGNGDPNLSVTNPVLDFDLNVRFTLQLLDLIKTYNPSCKYFHFSSAAVYGNPLILPVSESASISPISPYGWHKFLSEELCKEYFNLYSISSVIVRPFSVYGPGLKKQLLWDIYQKTLLSNERVELFGTGNEARDYIYIDDFILAFDFILKTAPMNADIYNIASGHMTLIGDIAKLLLDKINYPGKLFFNGLERLGNPQKWQADISKLKNLGFSPRISLEDGVIKLSDWLFQQV